MPNWVKNRISFNSKEDLETAIGQLGHLEDYKKGEFSYTWAVPYPNTKKECLEKYGKDYITEDHEKDHIQEDEDRPWLNWYVFHNNLWGCKWDASEINYDGCNIYFDSPWSPPDRFIEALAEKLPDIPFSFSYAEEQGNVYCGEFYHYEEDAPENDFWNEFEQFSEEASLAYNELWGETYFKCEEDGGYHCEYEEETFIDQASDLHYFDFTDLSAKNKELAKSLHENYKDQFDDFIIDKYNELGSCKETEDRDKEFEKVTEFLKEAIGLYKPIWDDENANPDEYEIDHEYKFVSSFEEEYADSFES